MPWNDVCRVPDYIRYPIEFDHGKEYGFRGKYGCRQNEQLLLVPDQQRVSFQRHDHQKDSASQIDMKPAERQFRNHGRTGFRSETDEKENHGQNHQKAAGPDVTDRVDPSADRHTVPHGIHRFFNCVFGTHPF